jgi:hypothetical protein
VKEVLERAVDGHILQGAASTLIYWLQGVVHEVLQLEHVDTLMCGFDVSGLSEGDEVWLESQG